MTINPERVLGDLTHQRSIGAYKTGVHRPTLSPQDMQARHWLADRLRELDYDVSIDGIANVVGSNPVTAHACLPVPPRKPEPRRVARRRARRGLRA